MSQLSLFGNESGAELPSYRGGSHVNLTVLQENVKRLVMNVICGENLQDSFAKLSQDGSWGKMLQGYYQASLDGSLEEYLGTWPNWGMMSDGVAIQHTQLVDFSPEKGYSLLPRPVKSDQNASPKNRYIGSPHYRHNFREALRYGPMDGTYPSPWFTEFVMGYPIGWTELEA